MVCGFLGVLLGEGGVLKFFLWFYFALKLLRVVVLGFQVTNLRVVFAKAP